MKGLKWTTFTPSATTQRRRYRGRVLLRRLYITGQITFTKTDGKTGIVANVTLVADSLAGTAGPEPRWMG